MMRYSSTAVLGLFLLLILLAAFGCSNSSESGLVSDGDAEAADGDEATDGDDVTDGDEGESDGDEEDEADEPGDVEPLFVQGCPISGQATALEIVDPELKMQGPDAINRVGDFLLMNEQAAFIIEAPSNIDAYYVYGGILVDAVALDGCSQANDDHFEELGFLMGNLNISDYAASILRAFRGDSAEIINDGSDGGDAIVRVTGTDDHFWLVEDELIKESFKGGKGKSLSEPFGLEIAVDYILSPGSRVIRIEVTLTNTNDEPLELILGSEIMFGDATPVNYYADAPISIAGYGLNKGIPWMVASGGFGAWALAMYDADMTGTNISGVTALLDFSQTLTNPLIMAAAGEEGDSQTRTWFVAVGPTDANSAVRHLQAVNPEPIPGKPYTNEELSGVVTDEISGDALADVRVELQAEASEDSWQTMDNYYTDADGVFSGTVPDFATKTPKYRLVAKLDGRQDSEPLALDLDTLSDLEIAMQPEGYISVDIKDDGDVLIPAKLLLYQDGVLVKRIFHVPGETAYLVAPGDYNYSVSRGFEYEVYEGEITVLPNDIVQLDVTLAHLVNTDGFLSVDAHVHAGPSPDNTISVPERIRTVAAEGLEVAIATDHEFINDWSWGIEEAGLQAWVNTVVGQEVTASIPEHTNAYPFEPDYGINARGGFVEWYGLSIGEIYAAERARGAEVVQLNHPRGGSYMSMIEYNRMTGEATLDDPTMLGLQEGIELWSWDFDSFEYMNGPKEVFMRPGNENDIGLFDDWMSFLNLGHRKTAMGNSDAHNFNIPGRPRNYFVSNTDDPAQFAADDLVSAILEGRSMVSAGAFARVAVNETYGMGDTVTDTDGMVDLTVHIEAIPQIDITYFKVYVNCDQAATIASEDPDGVVKYDGTIQLPVAEDAHLVVLAFGEQAIPTALGNYNPSKTPRVTTNAIFIDADGNGEYDAPGGKECTYDFNGPQ